MRICIEPSKISGIINVPPSKSYAHRLLIASGLTNTECVIENIELNNDVSATINCLKALGKRVEWLGDKKLKISPNFEFLELKQTITLNCLESGSTMRFFIPIALLTGKDVVVCGTEKLISRGITPYEDICLKQNIQVIKESNRITFKGKLKAGNFTIPGNISSQFITGLLYALPLLEEDSQITLTTELTSKNYVDITLDVLKQAGIRVLLQENSYLIKGKQKFYPHSYVVEGDYSNAAFLDAFNYLGYNVVVKGLKKDSLQGDRVYQEYFQRLKEGYQTLDIDNCIDLGPILFGLAGLLHGACFTSTDRLKIKESNRILAVKSELAKFGIEVTEYDNYVIVKPHEIKRPTTTLNGQNDHRIVMMLSVLSCLYGGEIEGIEAVNKSYPNFFDDLKTLGMEATYVRE